MSSPFMFKPKLALCSHVRRECLENVSRDPRLTSIKSGFSTSRLPQLLSLASKSLALYNFYRVRRWTLRYHTSNCPLSSRLGLFMSYLNIPSSDPNIQLPEKPTFDIIIP